MALVVVLPWRQGGADPLGLFLVHTLILALLGAALLSSRRDGPMVLAGWEAAVAAGLLAVCVVSFAGVDYRFGSFLSLWNLSIGFLLAAALFLLRDPPWRACLRAVALSGGAQALMVLLLPAPQNLTPSGSFANAGQLAAYLVMAALTSMALALSCLERGRRAEGAALIVLASLCVAALLAVGARAALLALLLAAAGWALAQRGRLTRRARAIAWTGLAVLAAVALAAVAVRFQRIEDPYRFERLRIWRAGLEAFADHPILGLGPGMFERRGYQYNFPLEDQVFRYAKTPGSTHSAYVQALAETGIAGFACAVWLAALLARRAWTSRRGDPDLGTEAAGPAWALIACLLMGVFDTLFDVPAISLTLLVLLWPLLRPRSLADAPLAVNLTWRAGPVAATGLALGAAWLGGVALPYAAHAAFQAAAARSALGSPSPLLDRAIALEPRNPLYYATRAHLTWRRDRPLDLRTLAPAHHDLERAATLDPGDPAHPLALGQLHARACRDLACDAAELARAERWFREGIALGRKDPRPHLELADLLSAAGRAGEALPLIDAALALEPNFLAAHLARARALLDLGRAPEAASAFARFEETRSRLSSYAPKNGYERDLMRVESAAAEETARLINGDAGAERPAQK